MKCKSPPVPSPDTDPSVTIKEGSVIAVVVEIILVLVIGAIVIYAAASGRLDALWG